MQLRKVLLIAIALMSVSVAPAKADEAVLYEYEGSFDDATFDARQAIIGKGLTIDYVGAVRRMLTRLSLA